MDGKALRDRLAALVEEYNSTQEPEQPSVYFAKPSDNLQSVVEQTQALVVDLGGLQFTIPTLNIRRSIELRNGTLQATANVNDLVSISDCEGVVLRQLTIRGDGTTKRGVAANGTNMLIDSCNILRIGRVGQESQAVAIWDGSGLSIVDSVLEAGSTPFLSGGAAPAVANHVPSSIFLDGCALTHPLDWKGKGYVNKTGFELKSARGVVVRNCTIENVWVEGQTGYAITLTPSQYGNSPETTVEDVLFKRNVIRNVGSGLNALGFTQHTDRPTQRGRNWRFIANTFEISRAVNGGHGSLMQLGIEPADIVWEGNLVSQDGDAFLRTTDKKPITGFSFTGNIVAAAGTYGVWTPAGSRGVGWQAAFPNGVISKNNFTGAHANFRGAFPDNVYK